MQTKPPRAKRSFGRQKKNEGESGDLHSFDESTGWWQKQRLKLAGLFILVLLLVFAAWWSLPRTEIGKVILSQSAYAVSSFPIAQNFIDAAMPLASTSKEERRAALIDQLALAAHTLCSYLEASKYPTTSRPLSEQPDQVYPNKPVEEQHASRKEGGGADADIQILTTQSRIYLASGESAVFTVKAIDKDGNALSLDIDRAVAIGLTPKGSRDSSQLVLTFLDGGVSGDALANDGIYTGILAPAQYGYASFNGTIRSEVKYHANGAAGTVLFDVIYTAELPATWSGQPRDVLEGGALSYYLKATVFKPGRYIVTGRVDDAKGKPIALLTFNDLLGQGANEIRLAVDGKLLRDLEPVLPLTLRDVEAYLLKENVDPDRALMPRLEGPVYVSKQYRLENFSDEEWQSEERSRYIDEYSKDVERAKAALVELNPEQARLPFPESECTSKPSKK